MIDINETIDRIGVRGLGVLVIGLCFCMMMCDGYDFVALSVAAPSILRHWHVLPTAMGVVFSVTFIGLAVGSLFYGLLGDRFGRRFTIIFGTANFGIPVLLTVWATNVQELAVLRFIAGIGMGGVVPIAYTMVSDYAPRRMRSTVTVITNSGYSLGGVVTGIIAAFVIPRFGWQSLFAIGAAASLAMGVVLAFLLPESPRYLALSDPASAKLRRLMQRLLPSERIAADAVFVPGDAMETPGKGGTGTLAPVVQRTARAGHDFPLAALRLRCARVFLPGQLVAGRDGTSRRRAEHRVAHAIAVHLHRDDRRLRHHALHRPVRSDQRAGATGARRAARDSDGAARRRAAVAADRRRRRRDLLVGRALCGVRHRRAVLPGQHSRPRRLERDGLGTRRRHRRTVSRRLLSLDAHAAAATDDHRRAAVHPDGTRRARPRQSLFAALADRVQLQPSPA